MSTSGVVSVYFSLIYSINYLLQILLTWKRWSLKNNYMDWLKIILMYCHHPEYHHRLRSCRYFIQYTCVILPIVLKIICVKLALVERRCSLLLVRVHIFSIFRVFSCLIIIRMSRNCEKLYPWHLWKLNLQPP